MKKILFSISILICSAAFATDSGKTDLNNLELKAAINALGQCEMFPAGEIPSQWQAVSSCDEIVPENFGQTPDELSRRRWGASRWTHLQNTSKKENIPDYYKPKLGSGTWTRGRISDQDEDIEEKKETSRKRTFSLRGGYSKLGYVQNHPLRSQYEEQKESRIERSAYTRPRQMSAARATREKLNQGRRSYQQKFTQARKTHFKRNLGDKRVWKNIHQMNNASSKDKNKKEDALKPKLRRTYRGKRLEADLEN